MSAVARAPTANTLNHHGLVQIGLIKTIWTTVSQMNGIPFHTRQLFFRSPLFPFLPLELPFFHKSLLQTSSSGALIPFWGYVSYCSCSDKCLRTRDAIRLLCYKVTHEWMQGLRSFMSLGTRPFAREPCVWFLFSSPANEPCLFQCSDSVARGQKRSTGLREGHSRHSSVCLTHQGGRLLCCF